MQKKIANKRGQTQWEITGWILALLVLVAIGFIVYYFMQSSGDVTDNMIKKAEVIAQTCSKLADPKFVNSYCLQLRKIDSKNYVTCDSLAVGADKKYGVVIEGGESMEDVCSEFNEQLIARINLKCEEIKKSGAEVGGRECKKLEKGWGTLSSGSLF